MKLVGGGLSKASLRFFSSILLRRRRGRPDWLPILIAINMLLFLGLVALYLLRHRAIG